MDMPPPIAADVRAQTDPQSAGPGGTDRQTDRRTDGRIAASLNDLYVGDIIMNTSAFLC